MIFLPFSSLALEQFTATEEGVTVVASLTPENGTCPDCQSCSSRVHSRYQRTLQDLPASGVAVHLKLHVRRFFCDNPSCQRKTFAEAVPDVTARYARKTVRLTDILKGHYTIIEGETLRYYPSLFLPPAIGPAQSSHEASRTM